MTTPYTDTPPPTPQQQPEIMLPPTQPPNPNSRRIMASSLLLFVILIGLVSYAVFKKSPDTSTNPANITTVQAPAAIAPAIVSITNTGFVPATVSIKIGQAVAWTNTDSSPHSVTSDDPRPMAGIPDPDSQTAISQNNTYDYVFDKAGIYSYHDDNNLAFRATVVVK